MTFEEMHINALQVACTLDVPTGAFSFGGGVWVHDARDPRPGGSWHCYRLRYSVDPQALTALSPAKVDSLRLDALSLLDAFPDTLRALELAGCGHVDIVQQPIRTPADVAAWAYSIFNGATPAAPTPDGDQYPCRVASTAALVQEDFCVIHPDIQGHVAVLPEPEKRTRVYWATPNSDYRIGHVLGPRHPVSRAAWANQASALTKEHEPA
jgi:hypothetical protein